MADLILPSVKTVWQQWNLRGCLLFSLSLQTILVLIAPSRKRTARRFIILMVWSCYLLADAMANFAVGLISYSQISETSCSNDKTAPKENSDLLAFWAPFLLFHLGGPDTITAFALEDNALWLRHLLALIIQAVAIGYVFLQTFPTNKVMIPTFLMFLAGIIKYLERTRSLYLASMDRFRDSIVEEYVSKKVAEHATETIDMPEPEKMAQHPTEIIDMPEPEKVTEHPTEIIDMPEPDQDMTDPKTKKVTMEELKVLQNAYRWFNLLKGLIVNLIFTFEERNPSREFFLGLEPEDALRVIEVEFSFIYEILFTKVVIVHSYWGIVFRLLAFSSIVTSLGVFRFHVKKHGYYNDFDVGVTYALLFGAIDTISLLISIFSDWTMASIYKPDKELASLYKPDKERASWWRVLTDFIYRKTKPFFVKFIEFKRSCQYEYKIRPVFNKKKLPLVHTVDDIPFMFRRWSRTVNGYNLIRYCLKGRPESVYEVRRVTILSIAAKFLRLNLLCEFVHRIINKVAKLVGKLLAFLLFPLKQVIKILRINIAAGALSLTLGRVKDWLIDQVGFKDFVDEIIYSSKEPFTKEIWTFIFNELQRKSRFATDRGKAETIFSARGEWTIKGENYSEDRTDLMNDPVDRPDLTRYVVDVPYDESLLLWHVATELLYNLETPELVSNEMLFSKILSDYMLYLLIVQPSMMASEADIGKIRYRKACEEAEEIFKSKNLGWKDLEDACQQILGVDEDRTSRAPFLSDARRLAKELQKLKEKKWQKLSRIWVELLSYSAGNITVDAHAEQVRKGGELVSLVWLLMAYFRIVDQFRMKDINF